jgi:AraC-like DNA-binding protein
MLIQRSTADVREPRRFEFWREAVCDTFVGLDPRRRERDDDLPFDGEIVGGQIGDVVLCTVTANAHEVHRTSTLIRRTGGDFLFVSLLLDGDAVCVQDDRVAELARPGHLVLYDSARPYRFAFREYSRQLVVRIPRDELAHRLRRVERLTARPVAGDDGLGGFARELLQSLAAHVDDVDPHVTSQLLGNVLDVLSAAFADSAGLGPEMRTQRVIHLRRAQECIRRRLSDPDLTPAHVAQEIGISERYLYAVFRDEGMSPGKAIMNERLAQARAYLSRPRMLSGTVEGMALRLGFKHASHFTRAFKERYGLPPGQYRERALAGSSPPSG